MGVSGSGFQIFLSKRSGTRLRRLAGQGDSLPIEVHKDSGRFARNNLNRIDGGKLFHIAGIHASRKTWLAVADRDGDLCVRCGACELARQRELIRFFQQHDLRLRHHCRELAVAAGDFGLPDHGGSAAMQRRAFGVRGVADRDDGEEIGFALDRRGTAPLGRFATVAVPPRLSASAMTAPPCSTSPVVQSSGRTCIEATTRSGPTSLSWMPSNPGNSGLNIC